MKIKVIIIHYFPRELGGVSKDTLKGLEELSSNPFIKFSFFYGSERNAGITSSNEIWQQIKVYDYLLFINADIGFTLDNVFQLIETKADVIGGAYPYKEDNLKDFFVAMKENIRIPTHTKGILSVDRVGAGFFLTKSRVFSKIKYPYFERRSFEKEDGTAEYLEDDWYFCDKCREADFLITLHANLYPKLRHVNFNE